MKKTKPIWHPEISQNADFPHFPLFDIIALTLYFIKYIILHFLANVMLISLICNQCLSDNCITPQLPLSLCIRSWKINLSIQRFLICILCLCIFVYLHLCFCIFVTYIFVFLYFTYLNICPSFCIKSWKIGLSLLCSLHPFCNLYRLFLCFNIPNIGLSRHTVYYIKCFTIVTQIV